MVINSRITFVYVVVNFLSQVIFVFLGMVTYVDEVETKEKYKITWDQSRPGGGGGGGWGLGVVVYQYIPKKFAKIPKNTQNSSKYTQNYTQVYFIPEIQRKWYTEYLYYTVYPI